MPADKGIVFILVLFFGLIGAVLVLKDGGGAPASQGGGYQFKIIYDSPQNSVYLQMEQGLKQNKAFEQIADGLTAAFKLPRDLEIHLAECGMINCYYDLQKGQLFMCYEFMEYIPQSFQNVAKDQAELEKATGSSIIFVLFHEVGHALIDMYNLPVTGKEEDAVDQLSTLIMIEAGPEGEEAAMYGASFFGLQTLRNQNTQDIPYWDVHSLDAQRFYNILCWVYGKDPQKYASLVTDGTLPEQRAVTCQYEYAKIKNSWNTLLMPHEKK